MMFQVLFNHIFSHLANSCTKITSCPKMLPPIPFFQYRKFFKQFTCCSSFYSSHQFTWSNCWGRRNQNMNVVFTNNPFQNFNFKRLARLSNQLPNTQGNVSDENPITIFCNPNKVILNFKYSMTAISINPFLSCRKHPL